MIERFGRSGDRRGRTNRTLCPPSAPAPWRC